MKKALIVFDGSYYSESALTYAMQLGRVKDTCLVGIFMEDLAFLDKLGEVAKMPLALGQESRELKEFTEEARQLQHDNIQRFRQRCETDGWRYEIHERNNVSAKSLVKESLYADLIVTGYRTYFSSTGNQAEKTLIHDLLKGAHCPVVVVPENAKPIEQIILTYDGSLDAIFAIKQFAALCPELVKGKEVLLTSVMSEGEEAVKDAELLLEYVVMHFPQVKLEKLEGQPAQALMHYAELATGPLMITGSFGRSRLSEWLSPSLGKQLVEKQVIPIFVSHH